MANHTFAENVHRNTELWLNAKAAIREKGVDCPLSTPVANVPGKIADISGDGVELGSVITNVGDTVTKIETTLTDYLTLELPRDEGVTTIARACGQGNCDFNKLIIDSNYRTIANGDYDTHLVGAFANCYNLGVVIIKDGLTSIGNYAFYYDNTVKELKIVIPTSVTRIGERALHVANTSQIGGGVRMRIYYRGSETEWNAIAKGTNACNHCYIHHNYTGDGSEL